MKDISGTLIIKFDIVSCAGVYLGFIDNLKPITNELEWRDGSEKRYEYFAEVLTLGEIYEQVKKKWPNEGNRPIITVFQIYPMHGKIYQCGNYKDGLWVDYGTTIGYA